MKIKNAILIDDGFVPALEALLEKPMPAKQCLELSTCLEDLVDKINALRRARKAIALKYALKDEQGNMKSTSDGNIAFASDEDKKKCEDEILEILNDSTDVGLSQKVKVKENEIFTPRQMRLLKDMVEIEEVAKEP